HRIATALLRRAPFPWRGARLTPPARSVALRAMSDAHAPRRVFITAAEVSGDQHAAELARSLRELDPAIVVEGLGGPRMQEVGAVIHHETVGRAAMLLHGAGRAFEMWRLLRWTRGHYQRQRPSLHVCVDSSGVNLHF